VSTVRTTVVCHSDYVSVPRSLY